MELISVEFCTNTDTVYGGDLDFHYVPELQNVELESLIQSALHYAPKDEPIFVTIITTKDPEIEEGPHHKINVLDSGDYIVNVEEVVYY